MWNYYLLIPLLLSLCDAQRTIFLPGETRLKGSGPESCPASDPNLYYQPVIGILTHPGDGASGRLSNQTDGSYIAASYVKFVEAAGARVIPLIYNQPSEILHRKLSLVNGMLFTGGWKKEGQYFEVVKEIFKKTIEKNDAGDNFPIFAICLGFELLTMIVSKDNNILEEFTAKNQASPLQFTKGLNFEGTIFQKFPPDLLEKLSTNCLVIQSHHSGISPETFSGNADLCSFFNILSISTDSNNNDYVSTVQAHRYPITGFQWHPEKNAFEWGLSRIPHSEDAIRVTQHAANYLVSEARKSSNRPPIKEVLDNLIYNYSPVYGGKAGKGYDEVYLFDKP